MEFDNQMFFDETSEFYNSMINSEKAIVRKVELFAKLKINNQNVADLGCGSGVDSIALTKCSNVVDAFDPSPKMIELAERSAEAKGLNVNFYNFPIEGIPEEFNRKYSFICSLGNTIANIDHNNLYRVFQKIKTLLEPDGRAIIHILNFDLILSKQERIVNITANEDFQFIRFYDFKNDYIVFNILKFNKENPKEHKLISTNLFPHTFEKIFTILQKTNFSSLGFYGSFNFERFDIATSKDLLISITK